LITGRMGHQHPLCRGSGHRIGRVAGPMTEGFEMMEDETRQMRRSGRSAARWEGATRQARLKREWADHYRTIPARFWTDAARLARLVAAERGATSAERLLPRWPLPDLYFEFRGGIPRQMESIGAQTRRGDDLGQRV
jgi:hypothetical protein